jgi:hypothetical protein
MVVIRIQEAMIHTPKHRSHELDQFTLKMVTRSQKEWQMHLELFQHRWARQLNRDINFHNRDLDHKAP